METFEIPGYPDKIFRYEQERKLNDGEGCYFAPCKECQKIEDNIVFLKANGNVFI